MKLLVESPTAAPMFDPTTGTHIYGIRPTVVPFSVFIDNLIKEERLVKLDELTDDADDFEFEAAHRVDAAKALAALPRVEKPAPKAPVKK